MNATHIANAARLLARFDNLLAAVACGSITTEQWERMNAAHGRAVARAAKAARDAYFDGITARIIDAMEHAEMQRRSVPRLRVVR